MEVALAKYTSSHLAQTPCERLLKIQRRLSKKEIFNCLNLFFVLLQSNSIEAISHSLTHSFARTHFPYTGFASYLISENNIVPMIARAWHGETKYPALPSFYISPACSANW
jgi:hypothetical protein